MSGPHRPIFVVGSNGSGSTLLRLMLDSHPSIAIPDETGFLRLAMAHEWVPYWVHGGKWHTRLGLSDEQRDRAVADFYGGLFASYAAGRGKTRWGDKTPYHSWHLERAIRLYPEATVVGIVRHPGAVAVSMRRRFRRSIQAGAIHWTRNTRQLLHDADVLGDRLVLVRYEDLVTDPEPVMRALLERLGEPWSEAVLAHHVVQGSAEAVGFTRTDRAIDTASLREWETQLKDTGRQILMERAGALASFLGYEPQSAVPARALAAGAVLIDGTSITAMKNGPLGAGIDWTPPDRLWKDEPLRPRRQRRHRRPGRNALPPEARKKVNEVRRSTPWLDRLFGPR